MAAWWNSFQRMTTLRRVLAALRRYRIAALVFFAMTLAGVIFFTLRQTPLYRADAVLELRWFPLRQNFPFQQSAPSPESGYWSYEEFRNTQIEIIRSQRVLQRVIDVLGLQDWTPDRLAGMVQVITVPDSHLVRIRAIARTGIRAAEIANTLAQVYIDVGIENRIRWLQRLIRWLRDRLEELQEELGRTQKELVDFQREQQTLDLAKARAELEREIDRLRQRYVDVHAARLIAEARYRRMAAFAALGPKGLEELASTLRDDAIEQVRIQLADAEAEAAALGVVYGPEHPRLASVNARIEALRAQLRQHAADEVARQRTEWQLRKAEEERLLAGIQQKVDEALSESERLLAYQQLVRRNETAQGLYEALLQRFKEIDITRDLVREQAVLIEEATIPTAPFRPNVRLNLILGFFLALVGAVALALIWSLFQQTIQSAEDIEAATGIVPLVEIPLVTDAEVPFHRYLVERPEALPAEVFRAIRTHILFAPHGQRVRSLLFTGARPGEGKTVVASNAAIAVAQSGRRVLLIDGDLRVRKLSRLWGLEGEPGFAEVLANHIRWQDAIRLTDVTNLYVMAAAATETVRPELPVVEVLQRILPSMEQQFDLVVFDGPPLLVIADALSFAAVVDEVMLVLAAGSSTKADLREVLVRLDRIGQERFEVLLNKVTVPSARYLTDDYLYAGYYGEPEPEAEDAAYPAKY